MHITDVTVIGAGPIGSYLALNLIERGLSVALFEKKRSVGKFGCSGLVSRRMSSFVDIDDDFLEHRVFGAVFHSPNRSFCLARKKTQAYVINRPLFDKHLFSLAKAAGAKCFLDAPIERVSYSDGAVVSFAPKEKAASSVVVGCDGACSFLRKALSLPGRLRLLNGILTHVKEKNTSPYVELFYGTGIAPGFFAWKIPRGERTEYGLAAKNRHILYFKRFLKSQRVAFGSFFAHPVVFGEQSTCSNRALLVGDAAAQVKPFSGGGLIYGLICAEIAARAIKKAHDKQDFSKRFFEKEYEAVWHKKLLQKIRTGLALRRALDSLTNTELDVLFDFLSSEKKTLERLADMDFL